MALTRRRLLELVGTSAAGAVLFYGCKVPERELTVQSPVRLPEDMVTGLDSWYASVCQQCPAGCGIIVRVMEGRAKKIEGNPVYPLNQGKSCARGQAGVQALYHPDRIQGPLRLAGERGLGQYQSISWEDGIKEAVARLRDLRSQKRADTVLLVTEPLRGHVAMLVNEFSKGYGAEQVPFEAVEQTVLRATMKRLFGQEALPDLDIENNEYLLSFGADFLETWLSPVRYAHQYGRFRQGRPGKRGILVQVDPRFSMTAANADQWVPIRPGTEGVLALSIAYVIVSKGWGDQGAAQAMTGGKGAAALEEYRPDRASQATGVSEQRIEEIAKQFATKRSMAIGGGPAAAHTNGLFNLTAIYSLNFLSGTLGREGGLRFSPPSPISGVPSAPKVSSFQQWQVVADRLRKGDPKAVGLVMVRGANPVYGLPASMAFGDALKRAPFIVSFSSFMDETTAMADLILPDNLYLESWGDDLPEPGLGHQAVGLQQPVVRPFHSTRAFGDVLLQIAHELGDEVAAALPWDTFKDVLRQGVQVLHRENRGSVRQGSFEAFWNEALAKGGWWDEAKGFDGRLPAPLRLDEQPRLPEFQGSAGEFPFHLIPFSSISLTDGRGAHLPWLQATPDPITTATWGTWVEMNSRKAKELGLEEGQILKVESPFGSVEAPVYPHPGVPPDVISMPLGQGHTSYGQYAQNRGVNVFSLLAPTSDKDTGALAWAATRVKVTNTGRRVQIPKFEGGATLAVEAEDAHIIQIERD